MKAYYFYCATCDYVATDITVVFSRNFEDEDYYFCPICASETADVDLCGEFES